MSSELATGKEILSHCGKCQLKLAHIIMSMENKATPYKVQCKTCGSVHNHRTQAAAKTGGKKSKSTAVVKTAGELWEAAMKKHQGNKKEYTLRAKFQVGDLIIHPNFGEGIVQANLSNDRIEVLFKTDIKNLVHGKN